MKSKKQPDNNQEKRFIPSAPTLETREVDGKERQFVIGRGVPFNSRSKLIHGWFYEEIDPAALDNTDLEDMVSTYNHNLSNYLGRTANSTLKIEKRDDGLYYEVEVPDTEVGKMVVALLERKDIQGSSFIFDINEGGSEWKKLDDNAELRRVKDIRRIYELGPVLNPAYIKATAEVAKRDHDEFYRGDESDESDKKKSMYKRNLARRKLDLKKRKYGFKF